VLVPIEDIHHRSLATRKAEDSRPSCHVGSYIPAPIVLGESESLLPGLGKKKQKAKHHGVG
jgi:hypothetical protein